jgi:hypothetical protein
MFTVEETEIPVKVPNEGSKPGTVKFRGPQLAATLGMFVVNVSVQVSVVGPVTVHSGDACPTTENATTNIPSSSKF